MPSCPTSQLSESGTGFFRGIVDGVLRAIQPGAGQVDGFERVVSSQNQNHMMLLQWITCGKSYRFSFRSVLLAGNAELSAVGLEADLLFPGGQGRVSLGASHENDIVAAQLIVGSVKILPKRYRVFERIQIVLLKLLSRISIRSRVSYGSIYDDRSGKMPADVGSQIHCAAEILRQRHLHASGIQERLTG